MWEPSRLLSFKHQLLPRSLLQLPDHLQGKHPIWCLSNTPRETSLSSYVENTFVFLSLCLGSCVLCKQACLLMSLVLKKSRLQLSHSSLGHEDEGFRSHFLCCCLSTRRLDSAPLPSFGLPVLSFGFIHSKSIK